MFPVPVTTSSLPQDEGDADVGEYEKRTGKSTGCISHV